MVCGPSWDLRTTQGLFASLGRGARKVGTKIKLLGCNKNSLIIEIKYNIVIAVVIIMKREITKERGEYKPDR